MMPYYKFIFIRISYPSVPIAHLFSFLQGVKTGRVSNLKIYYSFLTRKKTSVYFSKLSIEMSSKKQGSLLSLNALDTQERNTTRKCTQK